MTDKEAMQMALETLDNMVKVDWREWDEFASVEDFLRWAKSRASFTAEALRARLSQPEPKPVAWGLQQQFEGKIGTAPVAFKRHDEFGFVVPLYTAPLRERGWVGLTDEEKHSVIWTGGEFGDGVLLAEKLLKERNT